MDDWRVIGADHPWLASLQSRDGQIDLAVTDLCALYTGSFDHASLCAQLQLKDINDPTQILEMMRASFASEPDSVGEFVVQPPPNPPEPLRLDFKVAGQVFLSFTCNASGSAATQLRDRLVMPLLSALAPESTVVRGAAALRSRAAASSSYAPTGAASSSADNAAPPQQAAPEVSQQQQQQQQPLQQAAAPNVAAAAPAGHEARDALEAEERKRRAALAREQKANKAARKG